MGALLEWLRDFAEWLLETLLYVPQFLWETILGALAAILEAIPVPAWMQVDPFAGIDPSIAWMLTEFQVPAGILIMVTALSIRFLIRRLPLIG